MNSRRRDVCNFHVHRASIPKHLRKQKHFEIKMILPK